VLGVPSTSASISSGSSSSPATAAGTGVLCKAVCPPMRLK
jgi:hypothetical protein